ncbi:MAG: hypothetical protein AAF211_28810, partial [Myxococcota bacterium]
ASRLQNASFLADDPCEGGLLVRARAFAAAWRDAAQRARVQGTRTRAMADATTLVPIVSDERKATIDDLATRADQQARAWYEFDRLEERSKTQCEGALRPAEGLPAPTPVPRGQEGRPVAIWVLQGSLCPGAISAKGVAVVTGPVCVDVDPTCSCDPVAVLPGAALAP